MDGAAKRNLLREIDPVFGTLRPLKIIQPMKLPTYEEVGQSVAYERANIGCIREKGGAKKVWTNDSAYEKVVDDLFIIYETANVPTKARKKLKEKVVKLWEEIKITKLKEKTNVKKKKKWGRQKIQYDDVREKLFDIIEDSLVPEIEKTFVEDQREERKMWVCGVDLIESNNLKKKEEQKERKEERLKKEHLRREKGMSNSNIIENQDHSMFSDSDSKSDDDNEEEEGFDESWRRSERYRKAKAECNKKFEEKEKLKNIIETVERAGISSNMACQIINDVKASTGKITTENQDGVLYSKKLDRLKNIFREVS